MPTNRPSGTPLRRAFVTGIAIAMVLVLVATTAGATELKRKDSRFQALPEGYKLWLERVELIILEEEIEAFLQLEQDYQRDAFIEKFWRIRDPYPDTTRNEYRDQFEELRTEALFLFESLDDERANMMLLNGPPTARLEFGCSGVTWPLEVWFYDGSLRTPFEHFLIFVAQYGGKRYRLWYPQDGIGELMDSVTAQHSAGRNFWESIMLCKDGQDVGRIIRNLLATSRDFEMFMARIFEADVGPSAEWVATFESYSTDLPQEADTFPAELELAFTDRHQSRTVLEGTIVVAAEDAAVSRLNEDRSYHFVLSGELLKGEQLFENFRYKYDLPAASLAGDVIPLSFQRRLRPGEYKLVARLEDITAGRFWRVERDLEIPEIDRQPTVPQDPESARILEAAAASITVGETTLQIVEPRGDMQSGMVRFDTLTTGDEITQMVFDLGGEAQLQKRSPPWSVEFDLGPVPRTRTLTAMGLDVGGNEVARDQITLNGGSHRFAVRLVEPVNGQAYTEAVRAVADVTMPRGAVVQRVEFYLNEQLLATIYQPPFIHEIDLPEKGALAYVRAVAYRPDESSTEDLVFINSPDYLEQVEVAFVELYTTVLDRSGRPILDLDQESFTVFEDEVQQEIARFEQVRELPIHAGIMLDVSASMEDSVIAARDAALQFFEESITPKDRAALITFNDNPLLAVKFTNNAVDMAAGLAGIKAERGTALYDSIIFSLYYFNGIRGQRVLLVLSDGKDENSRFDFDDVMEYAHRTGVAIYAVGLQIEGKGKREARGVLSKISEETGGRAFFIDDVSELSAIYAGIQEELRSRYLIGYQSSNTSESKRFREVEVKMTQSGAAAKTIRGYYP